MIKLKIILMAFLMVAVSPAVAEITSYTQSFDITGDTGSTSLSIAQFDDAGGTLVLQSVTLELVASESADVTVQNDSRTGSGDVYVDLASTISSTIGDLLASVVLNDTDGPVNIATKSGSNPGTPGLGEFSLFSSDSGTITITEDLADFLGTGTVSVIVDVLASLTMYGGEGSYTMITNACNAIGDVTITYEYAEAPEPATLGLLGFGCAVLLYKKR